MTQTEDPTNKEKAPIQLTILITNLDTITLYKSLPLVAYRG